MVGVVWCGVYWGVVCSVLGCGVVGVTILDGGCGVVCAASVWSVLYWGVVYCDVVSVTILNGGSGVVVCAAPVLSVTILDVECGVVCSV